MDVELSSPSLTAASSIPSGTTPGRPGSTTATFASSRDASPAAATLLGGVPGLPPEPRNVSVGAPATGGEDDEGVDDAKDEVTVTSLVAVVRSGAGMAAAWHTWGETDTKCNRQDDGGLTVGFHRGAYSKHRNVWPAGPIGKQCQQGQQGQLQTDLEERSPRSVSQLFSVTSHPLRQPAEGPRSEWSRAAQVSKHLKQDVYDMAARSTDNCQIIVLFSPVSAKEHQVAVAVAVAGDHPAEPGAAAPGAGARPHQQRGRHGQRCKRKFRIVCKSTCGTAFSVELSKAVFTSNQVTRILVLGANRSVQSASSSRVSESKSKRTELLLKIYKNGDAGTGRAVPGLAEPGPRLVSITIGCHPTAYRRPLASEPNPPCPSSAVIPYVGNLGLSFDVANDLLSKGCQIS
ncbi:Raffinose carrier protein, partial [Frankliniella fusca]